MANNIQSKHKALVEWALDHGVQFHNTSVFQTENTGLGIVASSELSNNHTTEEEEMVLLSAPKDLVISISSIDAYTQEDPTFGVVWETIRADEAVNARLATMVFLLYLRYNTGVHTKFSGYIASLPSIENMNLPTLWPNLSFIEPTDIGGAVLAKKQILTREFDTLYDLSAEVPWCKSHWWDHNTLTLQEWSWMDAIYRSRVLDLPGFGVSLVPVIDIANHAYVGLSNARYDVDEDGNPVLLMRQDRPGVEAGAEITISYDVSKTLGEMIYSYGFPEDLPFQHRRHSIFLDIDIPLQDPFTLIKRTLASQNREKGVEVFFNPLTEGQSQPDDQVASWKSENIWLWVVFKDDGLSFEHDPDFPQRLPVLYWQGEPVVPRPGQSHGARLKELTDVHPIHPSLFTLRATYIILEAIHSRLRKIEQAETEIQTHPSDKSIELNKFLLEDNHNFLNLMIVILERQADQLATDPAVQEYLNSAADL